MPWQRRAAPSPDPGQDPGPSPGPGPDPGPGADPGPVAPELLAWANALDVTRLSDKTARNAERFLQTYQRTTLGARREMALRLRSAIEAQVTPRPPATVATMDVIATVLTARRKQLG